jgi:hypothetical protein
VQQFPLGFFGWVLAAFLRYPVWLVPVMVSQYARNHLQRSRAGLLNPHGVARDPQTRADWAGVAWALGGAAQRLPHVSHNRRPIRFKSSATSLKRSC